MLLGLTNLFGSRAPNKNRKPCRTPDWRSQLIAEIEGRPIGFIQIIDPAREEDHDWGKVPANLRAIDIWIGEAADLGQGYGTHGTQFKPLKPLRKLG